MKKCLVSVAYLTALSAFLLPLPSKAQTVSPCDASSYVMLPGGQCLNLTYLEVLGASRATRQQIEGAYQRQFDANVQIELIYNQYPQLNDETEEERNQRYQSLVQSSGIRDEAVATNEEIENLFFPIHVRNMGIIREAFAPY